MGGFLHKVAFPELNTIRLSIEASIWNELVKNPQHLEVRRSQFKHGVSLVISIHQHCSLQCEIWDWANQFNYRFDRVINPWVKKLNQLGESLRKPLQWLDVNEISLDWIGSVGERDFPFQHELNSVIRQHFSHFQEKRYFQINSWVWFKRIQECVGELSGILLTDLREVILG